MVTYLSKDQREVSLFSSDQSLAYFAVHVYAMCFSCKDPIFRESKLCILIRKMMIFLPLQCYYAEHNLHYFHLAQLLMGSLNLW